MNSNEISTNTKQNKKTYVNYKNTFVWGVNGIPFSSRTTNDDKFFVQYGKLTREPLPWREECIATAKLIYEEANGEIPIIFFSGGMDSQVVAESFRLSGVPFKIVIIRLTDSWNWHDMKFAVEWCNAYNVKHIILNLDVVKFWENDAWEYGAPVQSWSPQFCVVSWGINQIDGFPVIAYGEADLTRDDEIPTKAWDIDTEILRIQERYLLHKNRNGAGSFFKYTPELKVSQLLEDETIKFANNKYTNTALQYHKNEIYISYSPNLVARPAIPSKWRKGREYTDYNGFEFMPTYALEAEEKLRVALQQNFGHVDEIWTDYDEQIEILTEGYEHLYENFQNKRINYKNKLEKLNGNN